jgi:hypothetical protein
MTISLFGISLVETARLDRIESSTEPRKPKTLLPPLQPILNNDRWQTG